MSTRRLANLAAAVAAVAVVVACGPKSKPTEPPVKEPVVDKPVKTKSAEELFLAECRTGLVAAKELLPQILEPVPDGDGARTVENTLRPLNELHTGLSNTFALAGLYSEVHPTESIRDAARTCEQEAATFATELQLNRELYDAIAAVKVDPADAAAARYHERVLRDFRRAGVDKDNATRQRLQQIDEELTKLGQQFAKNIAEDVRSVELAPEQLAGLPEDFIASHPADATGKVKITTDYPDYNPFMAYAEDDEARKQLYVAFRSRGDQHNEALLAQVLALRDEKADLLGYDNFASYITEDKMIKSAKNAADFIERVAKLAQARAKKDYAELLKELKTIDKKATRVEDWQKMYLENRVKKKKYEVDSKEVRPYFPYEQTLAGLLEITGTIYDIQYVPAKDVAPWHPDVKVFDVMRGEEKLGRVYLDMHPRDGKYKHAAQFTLHDGVSGVQLPEGVLVCNFAKGNELMEHDDVVTMFHEFGHLMHHVLGGHHTWIRHSGVATEHDFVEAPSQMFEEWAWSHETLKRFAKNAAGEVIPEPLVARMRKADKFGVGTQTVQQMFYASISLKFHTIEPDKLDQLAEVKRLQAKYTPFRYVEGTRFHASFGHLMGYSAMYYTYMWSLVIAKDLLTPFSKKGLMDTATTFAYRDKILAPGGSKDAAVLVKEFLGRDYNFKAFEKYLAE
ncbi:MAG: Zn-dependent oligopeptidase [Kofleriaceae bacterium]|nr:MAG: Zn-dependent oligopeptidase [Kofleriaceae bacterium]MBZ0231641.1 Zn-dependent oligopeptidase [Kofleriaceae bacterium]